jgi:hypothetical protein
MPSARTIAPSTARSTIDSIWAYLLTAFDPDETNLECERYVSLPLRQLSQAKPSQAKPTEKKRMVSPHMSRTMVKDM